MTVKRQAALRSMLGSMLSRKPNPHRTEGSSGAWERRRVPLEPPGDVFRDRDPIRDAAHSGLNDAAATTGDGSRTHTSRRVSLALSCGDSAQAVDNGRIRPAASSGGST